jgi:hypothetical protein
MQASKEHIRHILLFEFNKKSPVEDAHKAITSTYGEKVIGIGTCQKWYLKFFSGNFDITDKPKSGRKVIFNVAKLEETLKRDNTQSIAELERNLNAKASTIGRHLRKLGYFHRYGHWVKRGAKNINNGKDGNQTHQNASRGDQLLEQIRADLIEEEKAQTKADLRQGEQILKQIRAGIMEQEKGKKRVDTREEDQILEQIRANSMEREQILKLTQEHAYEQTDEQDHRIVPHELTPRARARPEQSQTIIGIRPLSPLILPSFENRQSSQSTPHRIISSRSSSVSSSDYISDLFGNQQGPYGQ